MGCAQAPPTKEPERFGGVGPASGNAAGRTPEVKPPAGAPPLPASKAAPPKAAQLKASSFATSSSNPGGQAGKAPVGGGKDAKNKVQQVNIREVRRDVIAALGGPCASEQDSKEDFHTWNQVSEDFDEVDGQRMRYTMEEDAQMDNSKKKELEKFMKNAVEQDQLKEIIKKKRKDTSKALKRQLADLIQNTNQGPGAINRGLEDPSSESASISVGMA